MLVALAIAALVILGVPESAWAWGPVTHLWHGAQILSDVTNLPLALQPLLAECRWAYLYGCIAADIVQVKRFTESVHTHCHSWRIGWTVLASARSNEERAFAYGYLSHLAADVYSHNYYVPAQLVTSFPSRVRRHVYWEARFDAQFGRDDRKLLSDALARRTVACDRLVERAVGRTLFPFRTNRRIFDSFVTFQRLDHWQEVLRRITARSRFSLPASEVERYNRLCVESIRDLLTRGEQAAALRHDPNGHEMIRRAKEIRRKLRVLRRRGIPIVKLRGELGVVLREASERGELPEVAPFPRGVARA